MLAIFLQYFWYIALPMLLITAIWFVLFGVSKYIKATSGQKYGKNEKEEPYIYEFSYIWWFRNFLLSNPIINKKDGRQGTKKKLAQTVYLPKTSHILLLIGRVADSILGVKATKCK